MKNIRGVRLIDLDVFNDGRGDLVALEPVTNLPFTLRRVFYMAVDDSRTRRAQHATSSHLFLNAVAGSVTVHLDNGNERASISLTTPGVGIWVQPGVYIDLRDFGRRTVLLVAASAYFKDTRYFQTPQPDLIDAHAIDEHALA